MRFQALNNMATAVFLAGSETHPETGLPLQTGALPWRLRGRSLQVLLVTSRRSRRWLVPKGWPMRGKSLAEAAAVEAFEEAGVQGAADPQPLGFFNHVKRRWLFGEMQLTIVVHALKVKRELSRWPEQDERSRRWLPVARAAEMVDSPELGRIMLDFASRLDGDRRSPP